jgi:excisionase family DNA binding protein
VALLTAQQIADVLGVRESWVREHTRSGEIPHVPLGRYVRYREADVLAWVETLATRGNSGGGAYAPRNSPRTGGTAGGATTPKE